MHQPKKHLLQLYERIIALHASKYMTSDSKNTSAKPPESGNESNLSIKTESKPAGTDSSLSATARFKEAVIKAIPRKTEQIKEEKGYLSRERNFLTALRAMSEFLLTPADLEGLRKTKRRSPFENEPPITVYWRRDVEAKALKVWGSAEVLEMEKSKRDKEIKEYQEHLFNLKRTLRAYQKEKRTREEEGETEESQDPIRSRTKSPSFDASAKVVWTAVVINGAYFVMKLVRGR
ncbi:UNVERIFIED_CONTAM: hypothetical protein GTU68_061519 [Idotea baltica]|nr:hypothetical protein [Idotea baltica]